MEFTHHAPDGYRCPFCDLARGDFSNPRNLCRPGDVLPRWHDDGFYFTPKRPIVDPTVRARKADELRAHLPG